MCTPSKYSNNAGRGFVTRWRLDMEETKKARLNDSFGETAARIIIEHEGDLDETFGSAAATIKKVINGEVNHD